MTRTLAVSKTPPTSQLCVLGEHTDWAAGYRDRNRAISPGFTVVATTTEGLHARTKPRTDGRLVFKASCPNPCTANQCSSSSTNTRGRGTAAVAVPSSNGAARSVDPVRTLDVAMTEEVSERTVRVILLRLGFNLSCEVLVFLSLPYS